MVEKSFQTNPKYKDRLFCMIFGNENEKQNGISLYNALNGTNYSEDEDVEVTTIRDVIYINLKNDVSFIVDSHMSLFEQQSSVNPNMPLRGLMYFGNLYDSYVESRGLNIYGTKLVKIPTPQYYVLYNGKNEAPAILELKLSDAFVKESFKGNFEWTATFINLNKGKNDALLEKCKPLEEYMFLINCIRENESKGMRIEDAIDTAVQHCINCNVLREFLVAHRAEVISVCLTEFNEKVFVDSIREEGIEEGFVKGHAEGRIEGEFSIAVKLVKKGRLSIEEAVEELQIGKEEFMKRLES